jgi:hypothetical protein
MVAFFKNVVVPVLEVHEMSLCDLGHQQVVLFLCNILLDFLNNRLSSYELLQINNDSWQCIWDYGKNDAQRALHAQHKGGEAGQSILCVHDVKLNLG